MVTEINRYIIFARIKLMKTFTKCFTRLPCHSIAFFVFRITKVGARIVLLTSQALKEKFLKTVSKICGLSLDAKAEVQKAAFCNEADTTNSVQQMSNTNQNDALSSRTSQWYLNCCKYLKLGETDSYVLSFLKQEIKK